LRRRRTLHPRRKYLRRIEDRYYMQRMIPAQQDK
jgi:hypothetical protein